MRNKQRKNRKPPSFVCNAGKDPQEETPTATFIMFQRSRIVGRAIVTAEMQVLRCRAQISLLFDRRLSTSASPPPPILVPIRPFL